MTFKQWISLFEIDATLANSDKMGSSPYDGPMGKYEIDDNLYTPDNAELEIIAKWVAQTAGMYWCFKKSVRDALFLKSFIDAIHHNKGVPVFSPDGQLDKRILAFICHRLRLDFGQCSELASGHRMDLRVIVGQLTNRNYTAVSA